MTSADKGVLKKRNRKRLFLRILLPLLIAGGVAFGLYRYTFPYGSSHCCIKQLGMALRMYADDNHGKFPTGQATPEASLALLTKGDHLGGNPTYQAGLLRGKTVPFQVTQLALEKGGLSADSTGWHYIEGLTVADDPEIAIVWDKIGLGHNGNRLKNGGREVLFSDGSSRIISAPEWPEFLKKQKVLLAKRTDREKNGFPVLQARIKMPDGKILDQYEGYYTLDETTKSSDGNGDGHGSQSGNQAELKWFRFPDENSTITYKLTLPSVRLRSQPVSFQISNGNISTNLLIFEMEKY